MPKSITPRKLIRVLVKKGFVLKRTRGSHHLFQHAVTKQRVFVPLHTKDLPKGTLHDILKNAGLSPDDL